jgi:2-keto-4-pentenoate hydratase
MPAREVDPRVRAGLERQLVAWRALLDGGAERVGWKVGLNAPPVMEELGLAHPVIGFLTGATVIESGADHSLAGAVKPLVEPEVAIELRRDVEPGAEVDEALAAIESLGPALEVVDIPSPPEDVEIAVAGNIFHRCVVFGPTRQDVAVSGAEVSLRVDAEERERGDVNTDLAETIRVVADLLGAVGERLLAGDRIIAGSLTTPVELSPGNRVELDLGQLGRAELALGSDRRKQPARPDARGVT